MPTEHAIYFTMFHKVCPSVRLSMPQNIQLLFYVAAENAYCDISNKSFSPRNPPCQISHSCCRQLWLHLLLVHMWSMIHARMLEANGYSECFGICQGWLSVLLYTTEPPQAPWWQVGKPRAVRTACNVF